MIYKLLKPGKRPDIYYTVCDNFSTSKAFRVALHQDCGLKIHEKFVELLRSDGVILFVPKRIYDPMDYGIKE